MSTIDELAGASTWDEQVYEAFRAHVSEEQRLLEEYERLAADASSPDVAYLIRLIIDDEKRHHRVFEELARTVKSVVELEPSPREGGGVPDIPLRRPESESLRRLTAELLRFEREDAKQLRHLRRTLRPVEETTIWPLLVEIMELDTKKHVLILKHISDIAGGIFG